MNVARESFRLLEDVVGRLEEGDWERPSNLDGWSVRDVVAHVTGSVAKARGLARDEAISQLRSDPEAWYVADPVAELRDTCAGALAALAEVDLGAPREMRGARMPLSAALAFPVVDAMVHAWDIEHSLGRRLELAPELLDYARALTDRVTTAANPNFAPPIPARPDASATERLMAQLGRPS